MDLKSSTSICYQQPMRARMHVHIRRINKLTEASSLPHPTEPSQTPGQMSQTDSDSVLTYPLERTFQANFTMSQVYVKDRPAPVPLSEFEKRRKRRDLEEICTAGKRKGVSAELLSANMAQADVLIPGLVNMHKAKAADWVTILSDLNLLMTKLIVLRELFPAANLHKILASQPKLLLKDMEQLRSNGYHVRQMLSMAREPEAIIEAVPDLILSPVALSRCLANLQALYPGCNAVELLSKNPTIVLNMGEASVEDSAEYGEISTKD